MEIENNLISFSDVNLISVVKSLNQRLMLLHLPYKQATNLTVTHENIDDGNMYNIITNRQVRLSSRKVMELFENIDEYQEHARDIKEPKNNSTQMFLPLVEIPREWSCPRFIIRVPDVIVDIGSKYYVVQPGLKFSNDGTCSALATKFAEILGELALCDDYDMHIAMLHRVGPARALDIKVQFLDVLMSPMGCQKFVEKCVECLSGRMSKAYPGIKFVVEAYNEIGITHVNPKRKRWDVNKIIKAGYGDGLPFGQVIAMTTFLAENKPVSAAFSINNYEVGKLKKKRYTTRFDSEVVEVSREENVELMQLVHNSPDARFYSIVLDHLPEKYRTDEKEWMSVVLSFRDQREYRVLLEEFSRRTPFYANFGKHWNSMQHSTTSRGFLARECIKVKGFTESVNNFYKAHLELNLYKAQCKLTTDVCSTIASMLYKGLYYLTNDGKREIWWRFLDTYDEKQPGEIFKWQKMESEPYYLQDRLRRDFQNLVGVVKSQVEASISDHPNVKTLTNNLTSTAMKFEEPTPYRKIIEMLKPRLYWANLPNVMDSYKDVIGTENGILHLDLESANPKPNFITGYSKYYITKWVRARYIPYDPDNEYVVLWRKIYSDIFVEPDVCQFIWYMLSTGLDQIAKVWKILQIVAGGSNGKSVALDNPLFVLNTYAVKLRPELITARNKPGAADENLMDIKGWNLGIITETNEGDELVSSRIKELTEYEKRSRGLYAKNESFQTNITILLASNFPLVIDGDGGVERRMLYTIAKSVFRADPDPENPYEKLVNRNYETLAMTNKDAADALLSILVYERCQLQKLYQSNLDIVPIPTIVRETQEYKTNQNRFSFFLCTELVNIFGYTDDGRRRKDISDEEIEEYYLQHAITLPDKLIHDQIANAFINWVKKYTDKNWSMEKALQKMKNSKLAKICINGNELYGYRILADGKKKLDKEYYFTL